MTDLTRRYPFDVRPLHRETLESYTRRLLAGNFEDEDHRQYLLRQAGAGTLTEKRSVWIHLLSVKTKRASFHFNPDAYGWLTHPDGSNCDQCADLLTTRWMCTHCAHGAQVEQYPHFDLPVCIKHHRWVGVTGTTEDQRLIGREHIDAALRFAKLRRSGKLDVRLYLVLLHALGGGDRHAAQKREANLFPDIVSIAWHITRDDFAAAFFDPATSFKSSYALLRETVTRALGKRALRVPRALWLYLRGTVASVRTALLLDAPFTSAHPHDYPLSPRIAGQFALPEGGLERFDQYLSQTRDTPFSAAAYTLVGVEKRTISAPRGRRKELAICSAGHQFPTESIHPADATLKVRTPGCPLCRGRVVVAGVNDLQTTQPEIAKEFDADNNGGLTAQDVTATSHIKYQWRCAKGHTYSSTAANRTTPGTSCSVCSKARNVRSRVNLTQTHPDIAAQWHPEKNGDLRPEQYTAGSNVAICWLCPKGHSYWTRIDMRTYGHNCKVCSHRALMPDVNDLATTDAILAQEYDPETNTAAASGVFAGTEIRHWRCLAAGHEYAQSVPNRRKTLGCPRCPKYARILAPHS